MQPRLLICLLLLFLCGKVESQNTIGLPEIINYAKRTYNGGTQNWDIKQDAKGILYFANNDGLLVFDGTYWTTYPLPNKTIVRSIAIWNNKIYVGGQDEIGYFAPNANGRLVYHSLLHLLPEKDRSFADIWNIEQFENGLFFRTSKKILQFSGDKFSIAYSNDWRFMEVSDNQLVVQDDTKGLLRYHNGLWQPILNREAYPKGFLVTGMVPFGKDSSLLTTFRNGAFILTKNALIPFYSPDLQTIASKLIYTAVAADKDHILLGTTLEGCFIINKQGNIVQKFSISEGLQNNNIVSALFDRDKNLWLGLDNGIDFIAYNSPIRHVYTSLQNEGSGYASIVSNNTLYLGTSNGLYAVGLSPSKDLSYVKGRLQPVHNARGQVWNLSEVNGQLLMGHHEGAYIIKDQTATLLDNSTGFWTFLPYNNVLPSALMVTGGYNGINLFDFTTGFKKNGAAAHFESARFVAIDNADQTIWVAHPYKGIYKVQFDAALKGTIKKYTTNNGLFSANNNYVFEAKNHIITTTEKGIYEYNSAKDRFEPSAYFTSFLNIPNIRYIKEDGRGNIWFVHDKKLGVVDFSRGKGQTMYLPELTDKLVNGFEFIYPIDDQNILAGAEKGFFHINFEKYRQQQTVPQVLIRQVKAQGKSDSLLFGGFYPQGVAPQKPELNHPWNSLHFQFASTTYGQQGIVEYSYMLQGYDNGWSDWSKKVEKEYPYLPAGTYTFKVKARNNLGKESAEEVFAFTILPPWYQTGWAYTIYVLLGALVVFMLYRSQKRKFAEMQQKYEDEQKRVLYMHQLELEKNEKELIKLRNEKLEAELAYKNSELASTSMHLVQRSEMMAKIKEEMSRIKKNMDNGQSTDDFKKILRKLKEEDTITEDWESFAMYFNQMHSDFLTTLKAKYPTLTPNELKLCAYLRMNLSTKKIAQLMNISVRGVEISRYRLRKKLGLATEVNLFDFLLTISKNDKLN